MLIQGKFISYDNDLNEAFTIRRKVFVEEQGIPEVIEFDDLDKDALHVIVYEEDPDWKIKESFNIREKKAVATGRIYFDGTTCHIGHIAVLAEYRNKKYGDFTVRMLLNKAFTSGIKEVYLETIISNESFYKSIGFHKEGEVFSVAGIEHVKMIIKADEVITTCNKKKYFS